MNIEAKERKTITTTQKHRIVPKQLTATLGVNSTFTNKEHELNIIDEGLKISNPLILVISDINAMGNIQKSSIANHYLQSRKNEFDYYGFFEGLKHFITELSTPLSLQEKIHNKAFSEAISKLKVLKGSKILVINNIRNIKVKGEMLTSILALKEDGYQIILTSKKEVNDSNLTTLVLKEKSLGNLGDYADIATSYEQVAERYRSQGNYSDALPFYEKTLALREKHLGKQHADTATSYDHLAGFYESQGNDNEALPFYEKALAIKQAILAKQHPDIAKAYYKLAGVYQSQHDHSKALSYYKRALAIQEKNGGEQHPHITTLYHELAELYRSQKDYDNALPLYEKALAINEERLGKQHPSIANSYNDLAALHQAQGNDNNALPFYEKALALYEQNLGGHPSTAGAYNNLGLIHQAQGNESDALPLYKKAVAIYEKNLGKNHLYTANSYYHFSLSHMRLKNCRQAKNYLEKALKAYQYNGFKKDLAKKKTLLKVINWKIIMTKILSKINFSLCKDL